MSSSSSSYGPASVSPGSTADAQPEHRPHRFPACRAHSARAPTAADMVNCNRLAAYRVARARSASVSTTRLRHYVHSADNVAEAAAGPP